MTYTEKISIRTSKGTLAIAGHVEDEAATYTMIRWRGGEQQTPATTERFMIRLPEIPADIGAHEGDHDEMEVEVGSQTVRLRKASIQAHHYPFRYVMVQGWPIE